MQFSMRLLVLVKMIWKKVFCTLYCMIPLSTLPVTSVFKAHVTVIFYFYMQIKLLDLSWNELGNYGARNLSTCLLKIDELHLRNCGITECRDLCSAIQRFETPVSFKLMHWDTLSQNLFQRHILMSFGDDYVTVNWSWTKYLENHSTLLNEISLLVLRKRFSLFEQ